MARILIVNNNMHLGGVQKSLLNLLRQLSGTADVTLLLLHRGGELLEGIPQDVPVLEACPALRCWGMTRDDARGLGQSLRRSFWAATARLAGRGPAFALAARRQDRIQGFDVAVSFLHSGNPKAFYGGCAELVLSCVDAPRKVCVLHNDYRQIQADSLYNRRLYNAFDVVAACSEGCRRAFLEVMPELAGKTAVVPNCIGYQEVRRQAQEGAAPGLDLLEAPDGCLKVVTVARLGAEKGVLRAVRAVSELVRAGLNLRYYVIGDGPQRPAIEEAVKELGLEGSVTLTGQLVNPYLWIAASDLLLIPSYAEAAPLVVGEAACLGTPALTTRTSSAVEMVEKTGYGWVCDNTDEAIKEALSYLAARPHLIDQRHRALLGLTFDDALARQRFLDVALGGDEAC